MQSRLCSAVFFIGVLCAFTCYGTQLRQKQDPRPNILFVFVDDLRPELGCYGATHMRTPNIDRLASGGAMFTSQFVVVPTCGASRYSMLTGMLPRSKVHLSNEAIRNLLSDKPESATPETFIHHLRRNGYHTVGIGKISHYADGLLYGYTDEETTRRELPHSWDELVFDAGKWGTGWNSFFGYADGSNRQGQNKRVRPYEKGMVDDEGYVDGIIADVAIGKLQQLQQGDKPFFLGVGFFKPHLPFTAPARYWELYDERQIPLSPFDEIPEGVNPASLHNSGEFNSYFAGEEHPSLQDAVADTYQRKLRHGYFAAVSYVDAQVGKLLDELDRSGLSRNTIVVLWGDHGWHLGDHRVWGKHTLFEIALKSPLIIRAPGKTTPGEKIDRVVSSTDIYPTLMELCGLKTPFQIDGRSMVPLLENPETGNWEDASWSYYNNGVSLRTPEYRLTKYYRKQQPVIELFDHKNDPWESRNVADENPEVVRQLLPLIEDKHFGIYGSDEQH